MVKRAERLGERFDARLLTGGEGAVLSATARVENVWDDDQDAHDLSLARKLPTHHMLFWNWNKIFAEMRLVERSTSPSREEAEHFSLTRCAQSERSRKTFPKSAARWLSAYERSILKRCGNGMGGTALPRKAHNLSQPSPLHILSRIKSVASRPSKNLETVS
jgi:hypothetical protein